MRVFGAECEIDELQEADVEELLKLLLRAHIRSKAMSTMMTFSKQGFKSTGLSPDVPSLQHCFKVPFRERWVDR